MHAIVTCGPARTPIDSVRNITNFSTGEIGTILSDVLSEVGFKVLCFRAEGSTHPILPKKAEVFSFSTNQDLLRLLRENATSQIRACFHAAALSDFETDQVIVDGIAVPPFGKIRSTARAITIQLKPAPKILPILRSLMPEAFLVGWKYEVEGNLETAIEAGRRQLHTCQTSASIINGPAVNNQFIYIDETGGKSSSLIFSAKQQLADFLAKTASVVD